MYINIIKERYMLRKVKCQHCGVTDTPRSEMEFELVGKAKPVRKYYHKGCYGDFLEEKKFKEKERKEKDELVEVLKNIYGVKEIPRQVYPLLESLRNGERVFGAKQNMGKRYKQGYSYSLIKATFEHCEDTINYWNGVKDFNGFMGAFKYGLSIVIDKIYFVEQRQKEQENKKRLIDSHIENVDEDMHVFESNYKKTSKDSNDISDFLD